MTTAARRVPVTIACVFNDPRVLHECLGASARAGLERAPATELVFMDNTQRQYPTAGAALNAAAGRASHEVVAFVHQDVVLHDLVALEAAAAVLRDGGRYGLLGTAGIGVDGRMLGRLRDRVLLSGQPCPAPAPVDSLDEVFFMTTKELLRAHPLAAEAPFGWHAYAVEYGLRLRALGLQVGAFDVPLTHNSLTTNLVALDHAHAEVARRYPRAVPVRTTCGVVGGPTASGVHARSVRFATKLRRRLADELTVREARLDPRLDAVTFVDLRFAIDDVLAAVAPGRLTVLNVTPRHAPFGDGGDLTLRRHDRTFEVGSGGLHVVAELAAAVLSNPDTLDVVLVTNLQAACVAPLRDRLGAARLQFGCAAGTGLWLMAARREIRAPDAWRSLRRRPLRTVLAAARARA